MKKKAWFLTLAAVMLAAAPLPVGADFPQELRGAHSVAAEWANPGLLLDAKQVKDVLDNPDWVIVDCQDLEPYAKGHIPGAISLGKRCKKALRDKTSRLFTDHSKYEKFLGKVGIGNDHHVIFYGEHVVSDTVRDSAIAFWILEVLGHDKVHILNGGIDAWKNAGVKTVVTGCSDGYYAMKRLYPELGFTGEVKHSPSGML